jgi:hypothetical protein
VNFAAITLYVASQCMFVVVVVVVVVYLVMNVRKILEILDTPSYYLDVQFVSLLQLLSTFQTTRKIHTLHESLFLSITLIKLRTV